MSDSDTLSHHSNTYTREPKSVNTLLNCNSLGHVDRERSDAADGVESAQTQDPADKVLELGALVETRDHAALLAPRKLVRIHCRELGKSNSDDYCLPDQFRATLSAAGIHPEYPGFSTCRWDFFEGK